MADTTWIDWSALEAKIPEGERSAFEQAFSQLAEPADVSDTPYHPQATETVQGVLAQLEKEGRVKKEDGKLLIDAKLIPDAFQKYL